MMKRVLCLRPEADFLRVGVTPPKSLTLTYASPTAANLGELMHAADALVIPAVGPKIPSGLFEGSPITLVQVTGAGVDRVEVQSLKRLGITVANVPGGSNAAVAEYVVSSATVLQRQITGASLAIRNGRYGECRAAMLANTVAGLEGLTAGIIGLGTIGQAVARHFADLGCRICAFDPAPSSSVIAKSKGWQVASLDETLAMADILTIHVPLLPATTGLIGLRELALMKPGSILINAARGGIVDEAALVGSLASGHLGGAAVDVYSTEPPSLDNPLIALRGPGADRLLLTPHIAGITRQAWSTLFTQAWNNVEQAMTQGREPRFQVN